MMILQYVRSKMLCTTENVFCLVTYLSTVLYMFNNARTKYHSFMN